MLKIILGILIGAFSFGLVAQTTLNISPNYNKMMSSVVKIQSINTTGSGFISDSGYIISAAHVFEEKDKRFIGRTKDGKKFDIEIVKLNKEKDIAILRAINFEVNITNSAKLSCKPVKIGEDLISIGNPLFLNFVTTFGKVAGLRRIDIDKSDIVITDLSLLPGMSGGPVYNKQGEVVGINDSVLSSPVGMGIDTESIGLFKEILSLSGISVIVSGEAICDELKLVKK